MVPSSTPTELGEGSRIGAYRIVRKLGEGGMGAVFEAVHATIGRHVALKVLHSEYAARQDVVGRFFNEARAANLIDHPSIVQVSDFGFTEHGTAYIVMEFLRGEALSKRLRQGGMPCAAAVHITRAIVSALVAAHDKNIVHRDLKPDNVMLIPDPERPGEDRLKLLDFGIAKLMESEQSGHVKTRTNLVMGTPAYMSPEQCQGAGRVDAQSDVYSLGVLLYEMLSGRLPFEAEESGSLIGMHLFKPPPPLRQVAPHVPEPLAALTDRLLHKEKQQRPTMRQLAALLQQLAEGEMPLPMTTGGSWLHNMLRAVVPRSARHSTLGFFTGQFGETAGGAVRRKAVVIGGLIMLLVGAVLVYTIALPRPSVSASAPTTPGQAPAAAIVTAAPLPVSPLVPGEVPREPPGAAVLPSPVSAKQKSQPAASPSGNPGKHKLSKEVKRRDEKVQLHKSDLLER